MGHGLEVIYAGIQEGPTISSKKEKMVMMVLQRKIACGTLTGLAVLLFGLSAQSQAQDSTPVSWVFGDVAARVFLDPNSGKVQFFGYFADLTGIQQSLFNGAPGESKAVLTFRSNVFTARPLPSNGNVALTLVNVAKFNVYVNANPEGDWGNPDSFSGGQLVATFERSGPTMLVQTGPTFVHLLSFKLAYNRDFTIGGKLLNLSQFAPHGLTLAAFGSNTPVSGIPGFSVGLPWGGYAMATGGEHSNDSREN